MVRFWRITGYSGIQVEFERTMPYRAFSERAMIELLRRLASRHLTVDEVISSSLRNAREGHLDVRRNTGGRYALMTTGTGYHYTATVDEGE
jgi:hypothetical protein